MSFSSRTHGERPLVVHLSHGDVGGGGVHHEHLLVVAQLELRVERVNHRDGSVGLLEGDRHQKPVGEQQQRHGSVLLFCSHNAPPGFSIGLQLGRTSPEREPCRTEVCLRGRSRAAWAARCRGPGRPCTLLSNPSC